MIVNIEELIALSAEQPTRISRRSGVSRSTLKRVGDKTSEPTLSTLREVALALGLDITVFAAPASDPWAVAAARTLIDDSVPEDPQNPEINQWLDRFHRWKIDDPLTLVAEAGLLQGIKHRAGARFYQTQPGDLAQITELFDASQQQWGLSGAAAVSVIAGKEIEGRTVIWCEANVPSKMAEIADSKISSDVADLIIVPAGASELIGSYKQGKLTFVAPVQLVIDLYSLQLFEAAEFLTSGWR